VRALISSRSKAAIACSLHAKQHQAAPKHREHAQTSPGRHWLLPIWSENTWRHPRSALPPRAMQGRHRRVPLAREVPWIGRTSRCTSGGLARLSSQPMSATHLTCARGRVGAGEYKGQMKVVAGHRGVGEPARMMCC